MVGQIWKLTAKELICCQYGLRSWWTSLQLWGAQWAEAQLRSEANGLLSILQKSEERYHWRVQLMILTDYLCCFWLCLNRETTIFGLTHEVRAVHFDANFTLIQKRRGGQRKWFISKWKVMLVFFSLCPGPISMSPWNFASMPCWVDCTSSVWTSVKWRHQRPIPALSQPWIWLISEICYFYTRNPNIETLISRIPGY